MSETLTDFNNALPQDATGRYVGVGVVVAFHALVLFALVSGLGRDAINAVKKPLDAAVIQEVTLPPPPPPPPPPKQVKPPEPKAPRLDAPPPPAYVPPPEVAPAPSAGPVIESVPVPPPVPEPIAPPPPPPPAAPPAQPERISVEGSCPGHTATLSKAFAGLYDRYQVEGKVVVRVQVRASTIVKVTVLSGPREYHRAVIAAVNSLNCRVSGGEEGYFELPVIFREE